MSEEVALKDKFTKWYVYRKVKGSKDFKETLEETLEETPKPMSPSDALKFFKGALAVSAMIG